MNYSKTTAALIGGLLLSAGTLQTAFAAPAAKKLTVQTVNTISLAKKLTAETDKAAATSTPSLEDRIKELGLAYKSVGDGQYVVVFAIDDTSTTNMLVGEKSMTNDGKLKMITILCKVMDGTKEKKLSAAILGKIADYNYQTDIGRVGVDSDNAIYYQSSLWEDTATKETLTYDMLFAHVNHTKVAKMLKLLSDEG
jgi:hypothetical protein